MLAPHEEEGGPEEHLPSEAVSSSTQTSAPYLPQLTKKGQREGMKCRYKGYAHPPFS